MYRESPSEIIIIAGEQAGARALLAVNCSVTLSGKYDTDMVLRDTSIDKEKIRIITKRDKAYLETINGTIEVEGKTITQRQKIRLDEYSKVKIGETVFIYTRTSCVPFKDILNSVTSNVNRNKSGPYPLKSNRIRNNILISVSGLVLVLLVVFGSAISSYNNPDQISMSKPENIHSLLIENGYESLNVRLDNNNRLSIVGFVMTNRDRASLEELVDDNNVPALLDLKVGDQLAMEVRELFRVNGIEVDTTVLREGEIKITANAHSTDLLDKVKTIALTEIDDLEIINIELTELPEKKETIGSDMNYKSADKRITMVVDGSPAYIMTSDQSKYYIGALLPTGYKIVDIIDQQVVLEKQGRQKTLEF